MHARYVIHRIVHASATLAVALVAVCGAIQPATSSARPRAHASVINGQIVTGPGPLALVLNRDGRLCSGTMVSTNMVLTAAHCVIDHATGDPLDPSLLVVRTGAVRWTDVGTGLTSVVDRTFAYPVYDPDSGYGDAALLRLAAPIGTPIMPLATAADIGLLTAGTGAVVEGWGVSVLGAADASIDLRAGSQVVQSPAYCALHAQQLGLTFFSSGTFCAIDPGSLYGACSGDSGGPLVALRPNSAGIVQIGITSQGASSCTTTQPGFYTRVDSISTWVKSLVTAFGPPPPTPTPTPTSPAVVQPPAPVAAPAPTPAPTFAPARVAGPSRRYAGRTPSRGYLSFTLAADDHRVQSVRVSLRLSCRRGRHVDINDTWTTPRNGTWTIPATAPLDLTLRRKADRRYFRETVALTVVAPARGQLTGLLTVSKRSRAKKVGVCRASLPTFNLRRVGSG
jgi:hypothetical protein